MRLIDADELKAYIDLQKIRKFEGCTIGDAMKIMIDEQPTIEERKTGRWVDCTSSDHWKCSECGDRAPMYWDANRQEYDEWFSPYCPNCGADMRGEEHEL